MDILASGLTTLFNGLYAFGGAVLSWQVGAAVLLVASGAWMARVEIDELDRMGTKPHVGRH